MSSTTIGDLREKIRHRSGRRSYSRSRSRSYSPPPPPSHPSRMKSSSKRMTESTIARYSKSMSVSSRKQRSRSKSGTRRKRSRSRSGTRRKKSRSKRKAEKSILVIQMSGRLQLYQKMDSIHNGMKLQLFILPFQSSQSLSSK